MLSFRIIFSFVIAALLSFLCYDESYVVPFVVFICAMLVSHINYLCGVWVGHEGTLLLIRQSSKELHEEFTAVINKVVDGKD